MEKELKEKSPTLPSLLGRLNPAQYVSIHLIMGLIAALICVWIFAKITEDIVTGDPLVQFDLLVASRLQLHATPTATMIFLAITTLGSPVVICVCLSGVVLYIWWKKWWYIRIWAFGLLGGEVINQTLKFVIHRPRPDPIYALIHAYGYSFPSGHAMLSLVAYGLLAYFLVLKSQSRAARTLVMCAFATLIVLIGFSRLYLQVHYFSDVVAGYAAGGVWLTTCILVAEHLRRRKSNGLAA